MSGSPFLGAPVEFSLSTAFCVLVEIQDRGGEPLIRRGSKRDATIVGIKGTLRVIEISAHHLTVGDR
jgi:hypothetical protein